jgi:hypothetical protein
MVRKTKRPVTRKRGVRPIRGWRDSMPPGMVYEPQAYIDICLSCGLPDCHPKSIKCGLIAARRRSRTG